MNIKTVLDESCYNLIIIIVIFNGKTDKKVNSYKLLPIDTNYYQTVGAIWYECYTLISSTVLSWIDQAK